MSNGMVYKNEHSENSLDVLVGVNPPTAEDFVAFQEHPSVPEKRVLIPDPLGVLEIGQVISEEGHIFKGVDEEGNAILHRIVSLNEVEVETVSLEDLHNGFRELDADTEDAYAIAQPPKEIVAVSVPAEISSVSNASAEEKSSIDMSELARELSSLDAKRHLFSKVAQTPEIEKYFTYEKERLSEIAGILNTEDGDPKTLARIVSSRLEHDGSREKITPEGDRASLVVESTHAEKIVAMISNGEHPANFLLRKYRAQPEVQEYVREELLTAIIQNNSAALTETPDWIFQMWKDNPKVKEYLDKKLFSSEKTERIVPDTAIAQLKAKQELEVMHQGGLDNPASFTMHQQLRDEGIRIPKGKKLLTHEVLELLRKSRGKKGTEEIREINKQASESIQESVQERSPDFQNFVARPIPQKFKTETYQDPLQKYWENNSAVLATIAAKEKEGKLNFALAEENSVNTELELAPLTTSKDVVSEVLPSKEETPSSLVNFGVAKQYQEKFGLDEGMLEKIPGFSTLSVGQQLLLARNMESEILQNVAYTAKEEQKQEWQSSSLWGKIWRGGLSMGAYQFARTKTIEKELLASARGIGSIDEEVLKTRAEHLANIEEYVKVVGQGPDVEVNVDGTFGIMYVSQKEFFGSFENKQLNAENLQVIERYNFVASEFAKLPREWGYQPRDEKSKSENKRYETNRETYNNAREDMLFLYQSKFTNEGVENPEHLAMLAMNALDERMQTNQLFNTHPDAEAELAKIEDQSAMMAGVREFWRDKGKYIALGAAVRIAAGAVSGALTGGLGLLVTTGGIGGGVGYLQGQQEAKKLIRQRRIDRRMSEEDEREEIIYKGGDVDEKGQFIPAQTRKIKEFTDATFFIDRIERLIIALEQSTDANERSLIESKIANTNALMEAKHSRGLINFGGSSLKDGDVRKGNNIANRLSFMQAMGSAALIEIVDPKQLTSEIDQMIAVHQEKIEGVREGEIKSTAQKAAVLRGSFSLAGAYIAGVIRDSAVVDSIFAQHTNASDVLIPNEKVIAVEDVQTPTIEVPHTPVHEVVVVKHEAFILPTKVESVVPYDKAHELAEKYIMEDMAKERQDWLLLHDQEAQNILAYTRENVGQRNGALDSWSSIARIQEYVKAQGFTKEAGYTPQEGESLEQFLVRAHTEHLMKEGVVTRPEVASVSEFHLPQHVDSMKTPPIEVPKAVEVKPEVVVPMKEIQSDRVLPEMKEAIPQTTKVYTPPPYVERSLPSSAQMNSTPADATVYNERELPPP